MWLHWFKELSVYDIKNMSYTDFVGLVNQWNVLPWSYATLSSWIQFAKITDQSKVLEIACTTWFSIREISNITNCRGHGIDISTKSIESAIKNQEIYWWTSKVSYQDIDAYKYETDEKYTHIIVWAALKFFPNQSIIIDKIVHLLQDGGYLLASPFYIEWNIPQELVTKAKSVFDIAITTESYKEIMDLYNKFEILYEERHTPILETETEINYYVKCTIDRITHNNTLCSTDVYNAMFERLVQIKQMANELRPYQRYVVLTLRYRKSVYPNRFVELF